MQSRPVTIRGAGGAAWRSRQMSYSELVQLFFERSNSLQNDWNIYIVVIGALLGYSTFRRQPDVIKTVLAPALYALFAYKNLDAIHDVTEQRFAVLRLVQ